MSTFHALNPSDAGEHSKLPRNYFVDHSQDKDWKTPFNMKQQEPGFWKKFHTAMKIPSNQN